MNLTYGTSELASVDKKASEKHLEDRLAESYPRRSEEQNAHDSKSYHTTCVQTQAGSHDGSQKEPEE